MATNAEAAKNRPSERRPVFSCEASTTSAIIEEPVVAEMIPSATWTTEVQKMIASSCGVWFGGIRPATRSRRGVMPTATESASISRVTILLLNLRERMGTANRATMAER